MSRRPGNQTFSCEGESLAMLDMLHESIATDTGHPHMGTNVWMATLLEQKFLEEGEVQQLCKQAIEVLRREENVRQVPAPCTVVGDIHGQLHDFIEVLKIGGQPPDTNFVFMGDFVDRGYYSVECVSLVLTFKVPAPEQQGPCRAALLSGSLRFMLTTAPARCAGRTASPSYAAITSPGRSHRSTGFMTR